MIYVGPKTIVKNDCEQRIDFTVKIKRIAIMTLKT